MLTAALLSITVVINGSIVSSAAPTRIAAGHIVAPLPIIARLATRIDYDAAGRLLTVIRDDRRITVAPAFVEDGVAFLALAPIVRALGASTSFDNSTKTLSIVIAQSAAIRTPEPVDPTLRQADPATTLGIPPPVPHITPRSDDTGVPHPRRTAIPVTPSQPVPPSPQRR